MLKSIFLLIGFRISKLSNVSNDSISSSFGISFVVLSSIEGATSIIGDSLSTTSFISGVVISSWISGVISGVNNFFISSSKSLTVSLLLIVLVNNSICLLSFWTFNKLLACLSLILSLDRASWTSLVRVSNLNLLDIVLWFTPRTLDNSSWVLNLRSKILLYDFASSIGFRFFLWIFSTIATSALLLSFKLVTKMGTVVNPAIVAALYLLSPAMISYLSFNGLTIKGWIIPCSLIDSDNSFNDF